MAVPYEALATRTRFPNSWPALLRSNELRRAAFAISFFVKTIRFTVKKVALPAGALAKAGAEGRNRTNDAELFKLTLYH